MCESGKPRAIEIHSKRVIASHEDIDTHIELSATEKHRIEDITLTYIVLNTDFFIGPFPTIDITDFVENEYPFALAFGGLDS